MSVGQARLPASMVSGADEVDIRQRLNQDPSLMATLTFDQNPFPTNSPRIDTSSSRGPSTDAALKPDLVAVGTFVYTAWATSLGTGGYIVASGTSLSSPMVAGAAALLKAARPGLTPRQYRCLLINSSSSFSAGLINPVAVTTGGAGLLNMSAALKSTVAAIPTSLGFGSSGQIGDGPAPSISPSSVDLAAGASTTITVRLQGMRLAAGQYQGFLSIRGARTDVEARIPYWYGVASNVAREITVFDPPRAGRRLSEQVFLFRSVDAIGLPTTADPVITVIAGGGTVIGIDSLDATTPGVSAQ